ncbi:hypothetical protein YC2023_009979 [Brassica napus]
MSKSDDKIALPKRISEPGTNGGVLDRINKRSNLKLVDTVENILDRKFKKLEDSFLAPLWALSSVNQLGTFFGIRDDEIQFPLCLHWIETKSLTIEEVNRFDKMEKVDVKCILGDPELHSDLVEDVDSEFGRVVNLVKRVYRLKRQDWLNGSVDIAVAEAEVDENNSAPGIDATDQEKIEFLTKKVVSLEKKMKYLEGFLNIRGEILKVNGQNADYEVGDTEVLQNYIDAKRQEIAKGKKKGIRPPGEVDHQVEDDTEVEHGAKESDTTKVNEGKTQEEEEHQVEDDADVYDGEVNEDASKKPVKVTKKRGRGNKGKKKSVKPPREVQQQVEDDAEIGAKESENPKTNEDGEVNEDASKKPVKFTKKRERGNKLNISVYNGL